MAGPSRVLVPGPLAVFRAGFAEELAGLGYATVSADAQLRLMRHLSVWLEEQGLSAGELTVEVVERFVVVRGAARRGLRSRRALEPLLGYLRGLGAVPALVPPRPTGPAEAMERRFGEYLSGWRGLAPATVRSYLSQVRPFLRARGGRDWSRLTAGEVAAFAVKRTVGQRPRSSRVGANALRCLLRWMGAEGIAPAGLEGAVATFAAPAPAAPARALTGGQIADLIGGLARGGAAGLRSEAMLALMWRTGLRAGEVASLRLDDLDWRAGVIVVRGKGDRCESMPLPVDVGQLLTAYLQRGRPTGGRHREVFLALDAPHRPIGAAAVSSVAARAMASAGIAGPGAAHRLRHTAACRVLAAGGGLVEAGQLLRHGSAEATAGYARSDLAALSVLARPWPQGGPR